MSEIDGSLARRSGLPSCLLRECLGLARGGLGLGSTSVRSTLEPTSASFITMIWAGGRCTVFRFLQSLGVFSIEHSSVLSTELVFVGVDVEMPLDLSSGEVQRLNLRRGGQSGSSSSPLMSLRMASRAIVSTVHASWLDSRERSKTPRKLIGVTFHRELESLQIDRSF